MALYALRYLYQPESAPRIFSSYDRALDALKACLDDDGFLSNYDLVEYLLDDQRGEYNMTQEFNLFEIEELQDYADEDEEEPASNDLSEIDTEDEDEGEDADDEASP